MIDIGTFILTWTSIIGIGHGNGTSIIGNWHRYLHLEMDKYHPQRDKRCAGLYQEAKIIVLQGYLLKDILKKSYFTFDA